MPNGAYNWPGATLFGLILCTLISMLLYLSHLLQVKTLCIVVFTPNTGTDIYLSKQCTPRSGGLNCLTFDLHSDIYMYAVMKHTNHFSDNYVKSFWCPNIYE